MAKPHKHADLSMETTTMLSDQQIAEACEAAREQLRSGLGNGSVRLEEALPGRLRYSCLGPAGLVEQMVFEVTVSGENPRKVKTRILRYKTIQSKFMGFIPTGPKRMTGLRKFRQFNDLCSQQLRARDPQARAVLDVRAPV